MGADDELDPWACVVGRFQPFHRDHLDLVARAAAARGRVIVAITNADPSWWVPIAEAPHRHRNDANVFTFWQRMQMVLAAVAAASFLVRELRITPFPIHDPTAWDAYLPSNTEMWVRDRGPWEQEKMRLLRTRYLVRSVAASDCEVSGTEIRRRLAIGDDSWTRDVPAPVAQLISDLRRDGAVSFARSTAGVR